MPASRFDLYNMQDARNSFDAMRPTPISTDANQLMGQCQNIHISTNCYYGYHNQKRIQNVEMVTDCEMIEATHDNAKTSPQSNGRKRSADDGDYRQTKRPREDRHVLLVCQIFMNYLDAYFLRVFEIATTPGSETSHCTSQAQCDEVRLYFRGYGAINLQLQPLFTASNPQQSRYISLSHGPYDLISTKLTTNRTLSNSEIILSAEVQREKHNEPETNENVKLDRSKEELLESLYWNIHGGSFIDLLQCL